jgi:predicted house-cleaning noncanonical NTP pyrophosphatase (MazG superfamily)
MWDEAGRLTQWLGEVPVEAQLLKMAEEVGEAAEAYLGMTGLNPRKGVSHTREDLVGEVGDVIITAAGPAEYAARLRDKLGEEVAEFLASDGDLTELADILEVVYALAAAGGTGQAELEALRAAKAASNGAFTQRLVWHGNQGDDEAGGTPDTRGG